MSLSVKLRPKKCKGCGEKFQPWNSLQRACSPKCAVEVVRVEKAKRERKDRAEARKRLMTRSDWVKVAQAAFNAWVRERDRDLPCISCERFDAVQWHAGHYRTTKACPELRFEPLNVHKQCSQCNDHLSGNIVEYRIGLVARIGSDALDWLEGPHEPKRYRIEELQEIARAYRAKTRELKKQ